MHTLTIILLILCTIHKNGGVSLSETPPSSTPFAIYDIDVFKDGYTDLHFTNVAVFDSITSIQPAVMIPLPDNNYDDSFSPNSDFNPSDLGGE